MSLLQLQGEAENARSPAHRADASGKTRYARNVRTGVERGQRSGTIALRKVIVTFHLTFRKLQF